MLRQVLTTINKIAICCSLQSRTIEVSILSFSRVIYRMAKADFTPTVVFLTYWGMLKIEPIYLDTIELCACQNNFRENFILL